MNPLEVKIPYNHQVIDRVDQYQEEDFSGVIETALEGRKAIANLSHYERSQILSQASEIITHQVERIANLITSEFAKPTTQAKKEVFRCAYTLKIKDFVTSYKSLGLIKLI